MAAADIVQLMSIVVSINPYQTSRNGGDDVRVLRGLLLEYHPNGTLQDILRLRDKDADLPLQRWAFQIASWTSANFTVKGLPHMDVKPSNIVISAEAML